MESKFAVLLLTIAAIGSSIRNVQGANVDLSSNGLTTFVVDGLIDLTCSVTGLTPGGATVQGITWYHNGTEIENQPAYNDAQMTSRLVVTTIAREDGGDYHCTALFSDSSTIVSNTFTIVVQGIFAVSVEGEFEVPLGSTTTFRCIVDAVPAAVITWERLIDGEFETVVTQLTDDEDYGVLVRTVTLSDNGSWICRASGSGGGRQESFTVTVLVPPANTSITLPTANPQQTESNFELQCSAGSNLTPTFTWIYNGVNNLTELSMELDSRYEVDTVTGTLLVREATYGDAGTYTCIATNKVGKDSANATLTFQGRPEILVNQLTTLIKVRNSNDTNLSCPFISNPAPSSVEWRQGSTLLQSGGKYTIFKNNGTLHISNLDVTDAGTYTCSVSNQFGIDSQTFNLQVLDVPNAPTGFELVPLGGNGRMVRVMWNKSAEANSSTKQVEEYVIELRINDGQFELSDQVFDANVTSGVLDNIQPGESYTFRVRARNIAGLSQPSNTQTYSPPTADSSARIGIHMGTTIRGVIFIFLLVMVIGL